MAGVRLQSALRQAVAEKEALSGELDLARRRYTSVTAELDQLRAAQALNARGAARAQRQVRGAWPWVRVAVVTTAVVVAAVASAAAVAAVNPGGHIGRGGGCNSC